MEVIVEEEGQGRSLQEQMSRQKISSLKPTKHNLQMMPQAELSCEVCNRRRQGRNIGNNKHTNENGCMKTGTGMNGKPLIL